MEVDVYTSLKDLIARLLGGDREFAMQFAGDPNGTLAAQGITDGDLSQVDLYQLVDQCAAEAGLPDSTRQALQNYGGGSGGGGSSAASHQSTQEVVQHLNYVTYQTYEGDEQITQQLINYEDYSTNIDNSVDVEVDGDVHGDLDVETTNVNATGDGAVAAGDDVENAATGDQSQIIDGDNYGNANTGDGAVQAYGDIEAPVNTGTFTGVQADGDVDNTIVGDGNQAVQLEDSDVDASTFNFGDGDVTNIGQSTVEESAIATGGGDANNVADNTLYEGAAASAGGDATGNYEETDVYAYDSNVATEQGSGDLDQHADLNQEQEEETHEA
jgi:hypothetical protein